MVPAASFKPVALANDTPDSGLDARALALVNPLSGIANDYLNIFNEIIMLFENYPVMPDLGRDISAWKFQTYREYFNCSQLPGRQKALDAYGRMEPDLRLAFEAVCSEMAVIGCTTAGQLLRLHHEPQAATLREQICAAAAANLLDYLAQATHIVNFGSAKAQGDVQLRVERLMNRRANRGRRLTDQSAQP